MLIPGAEAGVEGRCLQKQSPAHSYQAWRGLNSVLLTVTYYILYISCPPTSYISPVLLPVQRTSDLVAFYTYSALLFDLWTACI